MKILKHNGKKASKEVYLHANTIIETAIQSAWQLDEQTKINFLLNHPCGLYTKADIAILDRVMLNHAVATHFACETWEKGWYGDLDATEHSIIFYFCNWGKY